MYHHVPKIYKHVAMLLTDVTTNRRYYNATGFLCT